MTSWQVWKLGAGGVWQPDWTLKYHKADVYCLLPHPVDGRLVASGGHDNSIVLWDVNAGKPIRIFEHKLHFVNRITEMSFSRDGSMLAVSHCFQVWEQTWHLESVCVW